MIEANNIVVDGEFVGEYIAWSARVLINWPMVLSNHLLELASTHDEAMESSNGYCEGQTVWTWANCYNAVEEELIRRGYYE